MSDYYVEVRVYRHDPREELPLSQPPGLIWSEVVPFCEASNATVVAERARKPLREAVKSGVNRLPDRVKPGEKVADALRKAGLFPLESAG